MRAEIEQREKRLLVRLSPFEAAVFGLLKHLKKMEEVGFNGEPVTASWGRGGSTAATINRALMRSVLWGSLPVNDVGKPVFCLGVAGCRGQVTVWGGDKTCLCLWAALRGGEQINKLWKELFEGEPFPVEARTYDDKYFNPAYIGRYGRKLIF